MSYQEYASQLWDPYIHLVKDGQLIREFILKKTLWLGKMDTSKFSRSIHTIAKVLPMSIRRVCTVTYLSLYMLTFVDRKKQLNSLQNHTLYPS